MPNYRRRKNVEKAIGDEKFRAQKLSFEPHRVNVSICEMLQNPTRQLQEEIDEGEEGGKGGKEGKKER